jgi:ABC-type Na+ efflux pump permease subunit
LIAAQFSEQLDANAVRVAAILFQLGVVTLLAPGVSSSLITEEISCGTFQALRMTTLSPLTLIIGKLKATFFYAMIFIFSGILVFITMTYLQVQDVADELSVFTGKFWNELSTNMSNPEWCEQFCSIYLSLFVWIGILLLTTLVCLCAGLFASSIARNTSQATAFSYGFTGILCVVTLLPLPLAGKLTSRAAGAILAWNPFVTAIQTSSNMFREYPLFWRTHLCCMLLLIGLLLAASFFRVLYLFRKQN